MDKVVIELVNNNGKVEYNIQTSGNSTLDNLGNIALQAIGSYIQYGNNPQGMMSQLMPMLRQMMGSAMQNPMNMPNNIPNMPGPR